MIDCKQTHGEGAGVSDSGRAIRETCLAPFAVEVGLPQADALAGDAGHLLPRALLVRPVLHLWAETASGKSAGSTAISLELTSKAGTSGRIVPILPSFPILPTRIETRGGGGGRGRRGEGGYGKRGREREGKGSRG